MPGTPVHEGGCQCGAVRYRAAGVPIVVTHCHCSTCRRAVGAAMVTWATFRHADVVFTQGAPTWFRSSARAERGFCARCGSSIAYRSDDHGDEIDLTAGTLDEPGRIVPTDHIWTGAKLPWIVLADGLPQLRRDHFAHGYPPTGKDGEDG